MLLSFRLGLAALVVGLAFLALAAFRPGGAHAASAGINNGGVPASSLPMLRPGQAFWPRPRLIGPSIQIAWRYFHRLPNCPGGLKGIRVGLYTERWDPDVVARGATPGCDIWIDRKVVNTWDREWLCNVIAHEYGHLLGLEHSKNRRSAMNPIVGYVVRGCRRYEPVGGA